MRALLPIIAFTIAFAGCVFGSSESVPAKVGQGCESHTCEKGLSCSRDFTCELSSPYTNPTSTPTSTPTVPSPPDASDAADVDASDASDAGPDS